SWIPTVSHLGNHPITIRVEDGRGGVAEQSFTLLVQNPPPNRPPIFTSVPVLEAAVGLEYYYSTMAIDPDADPLLFNLTGTVPAGMGIHPNTGLITWSPAVSQLGEHTITVEVHDGRGGVAQQTYTLCVNTSNNHAPVIVSRATELLSLATP